MSNHQPSLHGSCATSRGVRNVILPLSQSGQLIFPNTPKNWILDTHGNSQRRRLAHSRRRGGDGSYAYSGTTGIDLVANLKIKTIGYGVFHLYLNSWGYNYTWGSTWIEQHDILGKAAGKLIILEEYGIPFRHNHTATEEPWQQTVLGGGLAADRIWQFATPYLFVPVEDLDDMSSILYNDTEYKILARQHATQVLAKPVWSTFSSSGGQCLPPYFTFYCLYFGLQLHQYCLPRTRNCSQS
jgi:hypothetical protein